LAAPETYTVIRQRRCPDHLRVNRQQNLSGPAAPGGFRELDADKVLFVAD